MHRLNDGTSFENSDRIWVRPTALAEAEYLRASTNRTNTKMKEGKLPRTENETDPPTDIKFFDEESRCVCLLDTKLMNKAKELKLSSFSCHTDTKKRKEKNSLK